MHKINEQEKPEAVKATPWTFFWLAMVSVFIGLLLMGWNQYQVANASTAIGTVVHVEKTVSRQPGKSNSFLYKPRFTFTDASGVNQERSVRDAFSEYDFELGAKMRIAYSQENPNYVKIVDWSEAMFFPKLSFSFAGLFLLLFFVSRKQAGDLAAENTN